MAAPAVQPRQRHIGAAVPVDAVARAGRGTAADAQHRVTVACHPKPPPDTTLPHYTMPVIAMRLSSRRSWERGLWRAAHGPDAQTQVPSRTRAPTTTLPRAPLSWSRSVSDPVPRAISIYSAKRAMGRTWAGAAALPKHDRSPWHVARAAARVEVAALRVLGVGAARCSRGRHQVAGTQTRVVVRDTNKVQTQLRIRRFCGQRSRQQREGSAPGRGQIDCVSDCGVDSRGRRGSNVLVVRNCAASHAMATSAGDATAAAINDRATRTTARITVRRCKLALNGIPRCIQGNCQGEPKGFD